VDRQFLPLQVQAAQQDASKETVLIQSFN